MLILAFGVLAMGGLQLASLRSSQSSGNAASAAGLVKDMTEMMRSNLTESNKANSNPYLFDTSNVSTYQVSPQVMCKKDSPCTSAQMSALHVADWSARVKSQLPGGQAVVCRDSSLDHKWACDGVGPAILIKLGWVDKRDKEERGVTSTISVTPITPQLVMSGLAGYAE